MAELRKDALLGRWVIFSTHRGKRPSDFRQHKEHSQAAAAKQGSCAFCLGHENETGEEVLAFRSSSQKNAPDWRVRVAMNIYPALSLDSTLWTQCSSSENFHEYCCMKGLGSHEVVIESPDHHAKFEDLPVSNVEEILKAFKLRMLHAREAKLFKYCQAFKNQGGSAGASMSHSHSQLIALPIVPKDVADAVDCAKMYFEKHNQCLLCDIVANELEQRVRIIGVFAHFIVLSPYAASFPYESWIVPIKHSCNFEMITDEEVQDLAGILKSVITKLNVLFDFPPYNYTIQTAPLQESSDTPYFHWYIRVIPHLTTLAGFEHATGCYINPVFPEQVAELLHLSTQQIPAFQ